MKRKRTTLAGLLLAILVLIGAAVLVGFHSPIGLVALISAAPFFIFGTVTTNYQYPVQSTVAPTVAQMKPLSLVSAQVFFSSDSDTQALITHNMQVSTLFLPGSSTAIAQTSCLFPLVGWYYNSGGSNTTILSGSLVSSSVFAITKASAASSLGTVNVFVLRPWTGVQ